MSIALFTLSILSSLAAAVALLLGFTVHSPASLSMHIHVAWAAVVGLLFARSMTIFYLFGIGKGLSQETAGDERLGGYVEEARRLRVRLWPYLGVAALATVALAVTGGLSYGGKIPIDWHRRIAIFAVILNVAASLWEGVILAGVQSLLVDLALARGGGEGAGGGEASGPRL